MVGARAPGTEQISQRSYFCRSQRAQKEEKCFFLKDALWGGGGPHRSWPGERGRPRALIPGEGVRNPPQLAWWTGGQGGGARARKKGARASVPGG